jgi:hypothetical protein
MDMPTNSVLDAVRSSPLSAQEPSTRDVIEKVVLDYLDEETVVSMDSLVCSLPHYGWNQIFQAVDNLARRRMIVLRRHGFQYTLFSTHYAA